MTVYMYRFKAERQHKDCYGHTVTYIGTVDIRAPNLAEAIIFFKQGRHELKEVHPLGVLYPQGEDCTFTVEVVEPLLYPKVNT